MFFRNEQLKLDFFIVLFIGTSKLNDKVLDFVKLFFDGKKLYHSVMFNKCTVKIK